MRVAPLGAYLADNLDAIVAEATRSAEVTHAHPEGIAGAVAVAVAAAVAVSTQAVGAEFLDLVLHRMPTSAVQEGLRQARDLTSESVENVVERLGSGTSFTAQDTVPFALWCASQHMDDYAEAIWLTLAGLGDRDTTCAIAGGVVGARVGRAGIPANWLAAREPLPNWFALSFENRYRARNER